MLALSLAWLKYFNYRTNIRAYTASRKYTTHKPHHIRRILGSEPPANREGLTAHLSSTMSKTFALADIEFPCLVKLFQVVPLAKLALRRVCGGSEARL